MSEPAVDAIARLVPAILRALQALEFASRHVSPTSLPQLIEALGGRDDDLAPALAASRALDWPERLSPARACLETAAEAARLGASGYIVKPFKSEEILTTVKKYLA